MRLSLLAAAALLCASVAAHADTVTYTFTGTFTGSIGLLSFTDDPGTITETTDTSDTNDLGGGFYTNTGTPATPAVSTITLGDGIGTAVFLRPASARKVRRTLPVSTTSIAVSA